MALFAAACAILADLEPALADIAVRFPAEATDAEIAAVKAAVESAQDEPVRVFVARERSPATDEPPADAAAALERARRAYQGLEMETARVELDAAEAACVAAGSCAACRDILFDAYLLKGAIAVTQGRDGAAEFVVAHTAQPARVVDPRRFPPKIVNAFNRACADAELRSPVTVRVSTEPRGASLWLNGSLARDGADVAVRARRVFVEARMAGYGPRCEAFDVAPDGGSGHVVRLAAIPDEEIPAEAERFFTGREPALDGAAFAFLSRLGIDRALFLALAAGSNRFTARATCAASTGWTALPALKTAADAGAPEFTDALARAVGIPSKVVVAAASQLPGPPAVEDPDAFESEDEDEEDSDPNILGATPEGEGGAKKPGVLKSPWLWISVGIVVAVAGGVVIGTQIGGN